MFNGTLLAADCDFIAAVVDEIHLPFPPFLPRLSPRRWWLCFSPTYQFLQSIFSAGKTRSRAIALVRPALPWPPWGDRVKETDRSDFKCQHCLSPPSSNEQERSGRGRRFPSSRSRCMKFAPLAFKKIAALAALPPPSVTCGRRGMRLSSPSSRSFEQHHLKTQDQRPLRHPRPVQQVRNSTNESKRCKRANKPKEVAPYPTPPSPQSFEMRSLSQYTPKKIRTDILSSVVSPHVDFPEIRFQSLPHRSHRIWSHCVAKIG